jgi:hypothetical protein
LNQDFYIWISMKTRRCIMKAGSLDFYLLNSHPKKIDSKFGVFLRDLIKEKQKERAQGLESEVAYIPGTARQARSRKTKLFEYKRIPTMYVPSHVRATLDTTEFYIKPPHEMSRYELQELEEYIKYEEDGLVEEWMNLKQPKEDV